MEATSLPQPFRGASRRGSSRAAGLCSSPTLPSGLSSLVLLSPLLRVSSLPEALRSRSFPPAPSAQGMRWLPWRSFSPTLARVDLRSAQLSRTVLTPTDAFALAPLKSF